MNGIRKARVLSGLSQAALAGLAGVSERTLRSYEHGAPVPSDVLVKMVRATGFSADFMLGIAAFIKEENR